MRTMLGRGGVLFGAMCVLWGIPYLLIKVAVAEVAVPVLVLARCAVGAAVLLPLALRPGAAGLLRAHWRPLLLFAAVEIIGPWALLSDAERRLDSSLTGLLVAAVPIVAVLAERASGGGERLGPLRVAGLALGLGGVALLAAPHLGGGTALAVGEVLLVAVGYATGPVIAARRLTAVPGLLTTAACLTLASLVYLPFALLTWPRRLPGPDVLAALGALGLLCTATAFVLFFALIREIGPARAVVITYVNPAVAVAAGVLVLREPLTALTAVAFVLVLGGSLLATTRRRDGVPAPP
jgi:drug/metabolite transporter (DMT)-like permease